MGATSPQITFAFYDELPVGITIMPILISGEQSQGLSGKEYLVQLENGIPFRVYEMRFSIWGGPYREAVVFNQFLAVGHYQFFYLYDLINQTNILRLEVCGYFGHLYVDENRMYLTDASKVYCFNEHGSMIWQSGSLGIDGVYIDSFTSDQIQGSCQLDPPDGWEDFVLVKTTGAQL